MAKKKNSPSSLLDSISNDLGFDNPEGQEEVVNMNDIILGKNDVDNLTEKETEPDPEEETEDKDGNHEDDTEIPKEVLNRINNNSSSDSQEDDNDEEDLNQNVDDNNDDQDTEDPNEAPVVGAFFDAFAEALNWDVADDEKPTSIDGIIKYIEDVVEENSKPEYADERIAQLDQYVKNGGRFEDFYNNQSQSVSYEQMDMEDESNQKAVVRDYMKMQGFTDEQISRKIERYEDADMLADEAEDAVEQLKAIKAEQLRIAQEQQEQARLAQEEQARQFMTDLNSSIASLNNIRGIAVPKEDRKALLDYITKTDADGLTQYQKDFNKNIVNNLIESAYFTMKGDSLLGNARRSGQTSAVSKLRTMMKHQTKNHSSLNATDEKAPQAWEIASKWL